MGAVAAAIPPRRSSALQSKHRSTSALDAAVILLKSVVQIEAECEAIGERATPDHPDVGTGGETVHINGPLCKPTYAVGSAEWAAQQQGDVDA
jgi:hypothetical protein